MALMERGLKAKSYTGPQVHVLTDSAFTKARILKSTRRTSGATWSSGTIVVVAGISGR